MSDEGGRADSEVVAAARARIAELEQKFGAQQRIIEGVRDLVWRTDATGRVLYVNGYAAPFLGLSWTEAVGRTLEEYLSPESAVLVGRGVRERLYAKEPAPYFQAEVDYLHHDGHLVPAEIRITAERDASGRVVAFDGISRGLAERRAATEALAREQAFFEQIFAQSSVSTQLLDKDGWCERVNPRLTELLGVPADRLEGRVYNIFADEELRRAGVLPHLERVFREGRTAEWESYVEVGVQAHGSPAGERRRRWLSNWAHPIFDASGALAHVIIQRVDVTERRRTAEALAASEDRYRTLFEQTPDALLTLRAPDWTFDEVNPAAVAMFGFAGAEAFEGRTPFSLSPERQADGRRSSDAALEMIERALRDGSHRFEWTHRRASGEEFPATVLLARIVGDGPPLLHATVHDETEKRRLQASLAQGDRLASMGMLAAGIAHEINNPLAYVLASLETIEADLPKVVEALQAATGAVDRTMLGELVDAARAAADGTRRIAGITRGLGKFARVERAECAAVDVRQALDSAASMAHNEIRYRATLVREYAEVSPVWASEGKLSQVFLNLLINAAHATPDGDAGAHRITLRAWSSADDVFVEVRDTGSGISPTNLPKIFEPFFTTKPAGKGSGLGLAICRTLLAEFGGELTVESTVGKGSRFVVRLPAVRAVAAPIVATTAPPPPVGAALRGRVLVIDDEEAIRTALQRLLRREHEIVSVGSGREAQALLRHDRAFDAILCDLMMPELSGMEVHEWLARLDPELASRLVFVSGGAFTSRASDYLAGVSNPQLAKPFEPTRLRQLLAAMVARPRAGA